MGMKSVGGEIVQVQGGHIVRSTGRKDRHSKVYTAKGPRDRRVRLSAHTAIQFYDVQDRLGYDRPSKAVDWLIKKAKPSIDKLAELPPWHPTGVATNTAEDEIPDRAGTSEMVITASEQSESSGYNFQLQNNNPDHNDSNFIPQSLDSVTIADTMKSFFPTSSAASTINFQSYPSDIISRTTNLNPNQDLGLTLHTFQDQGLIHHAQQSHQDTNHNHHNDQIQTLFAMPATAGFDSSAYQRMVAWSSSDENRTCSGGGLVFNNMSSQALPHQQLLIGQSSEGATGFAQRGTLQSSFTPSNSIHSWSDEIQMASHRTQNHTIHHSSIFGTRFASDGLPVFCIPTRIHGDDADNGVISDRPSSTSSPNSAHH